MSSLTMSFAMFCVNLAVRASSRPKKRTSGRRRGGDGGNYVVVFDPLDGSSNIDAAVSTGSIWGIYESDSSCIPDFSSEDSAKIEEKCVMNVCQPGNNLLCAGYCMYSSSTILVLTIGQGVYGFTLDPTVGEFIMSHDNIKVPNPVRFTPSTRATTACGPKA